MSYPVIVIVGPTAVGKTDLSLTVAEQIDAEIINADSMQLYRGMDIGTAKVPEDQRRGIAHHMLDVLDVSDAANVADYQRDARAIINQIHSRGKRVVVVGGSGLFVQGLLEDLQFPGSDPDVRQRLNEEAEVIGTQAMYERLVSIDPEAAANILPTNERRIIRALEVFEITGEAPTTKLEQLPEIVPSIRVGLRRDREDLDHRIEQRVELMWQQGLINEVRGLESQGLREGLTASKALGYAQVLDYLSAQIQEDEAKLRTVTATRRYVRRQESWFNRDERITWFDATANTLTADVIAHINTGQNA
jgi:tRNA dimethylallyltransferase